jgi:micrococcal nuclease
MEGVPLNHLTITIPVQQTKRVIDGDTFAVYAFNVEGEEIIRVLGVDTPERKELGFLEAKAFTEQWLSQGSYQVHVEKHDGFGRYLAKVTRGEDSLDKAIITHGMGKVR